MYNMPNIKKSVVARTTTIRGAFVLSILSNINTDTKISEEDLNSHLKVLNMTKATICCAYCGGEFNSWDHINALVKDKAPSGYINEINNLIPSCSACNSSKGGKEWYEWMNAKKGRMKKIYDNDRKSYEKRIELIKEYTKQFPAKRNMKLANIKNLEEWINLEKNMNSVLKKWQNESLQ